MDSRTKVYPAIHLLLLVICTCFLFACSDKKSLDPLEHNGVILAFGDSLTAGVGASEDESYPEVLAQLTGLHVVESGVSGEETSQGVVRLAKVLEEVRPNLMILLQGGNDILRNRNPRQIKKNLARMIELSQSNQIDVVLIGVPEKKLFSNVAPLYEELASEYDLILEDRLLSELLRDNEYKSDAVHLNRQGYRLLAQSIHDLLIKHGALSHD